MDNDGLIYGNLGLKILRFVIALLLLVGLPRHRQVGIGCGKTKPKASPLPHQKKKATFFGRSRRVFPWFFDGRVTANQQRRPGMVATILIDREIIYRDASVG
jgi:hypothetical protein